MLYLATFPERVAWLDRMLGRGRRSGHGKRYVRIESDRRHVIHDKIFRYKHSAGHAHPENSSEQAAGATTTGLGIYFKKSPKTPRLRRPRSFDSESFGPRELGPIHGDVAATAPLPSYGSFKMLSPDASPAKSDTARQSYREHLENGKLEVTACESRLQSQQQPGVGGVAGVLESVNALIDFVARHMVRMTSDRVTDSAERGLLLPVKEEEREPAGVVF